ncbi:RNA-binding cell elongation regulator Jag/EloR [Enterococcus italicus]|uniref:RNA-binding cell elongation regulator Jag/EloR n=1 Tax=Enterococcus italicus TaxID=246144 RepID=UPI002073EFF4|nr:RNA-binding cell elongation regulator Jag/EloR [Enterococcus italicus]
MPIYEGATVEDAIRQGLSDLALTAEQVTITTVAEGKKGFLGLGKKVARVQIEPRVEPVATIETIPVSIKEPEEKPKAASDEETLTQLALYLTAITNALNAPATVTYTREQDQVVVHLETEKQGMLIGKHGKILNALQYLAQVFVHRLEKNRLSVVLNVGDYREKRQLILERLAQKTADKVKKTGQPVFLEPMPAFERKQIHAALSKNKLIQTHSEGDEPYRYLVVEPVKK